MKKRLLISIVCISIMTMFSGCGASTNSNAKVFDEVKAQNSIEESETNDNIEDVPNSIEDTSTEDENTNISTGYILTPNGEDYIELYSAINDGSVIARMYYSEPITVYSIENNWASISYGGMKGYVELQYISFSKPQDTEAVQDTETVQDTESTEKETEEVQQSALMKVDNNKNDDTPSINQNIEQSVNIVFINDKDGFQVAEPSYYPTYVSDNRSAWCSAQSIYIYSQPDTNSYKREADMLYYGDTLTILGSVDGWYYIATDSGNGYDLHGYVKQSYITIGQTPVAPEPVNATHGRVFAGSANVRSSPNKETSNNILFTVYEGAEFDVLDYDGYWYKINYNGTICYISHKMVEVW